MISMKHKPVPPVSPCVMDPGASGPPVDAKGDSLPIKPMERPGMRHTGALGAMAVPKVARPASARPDPHRPARQSMVMSRYGKLSYFTFLSSRSVLRSLRFALENFCPKNPRN